MAIRGILAIQGGGGEQLEWCGGAISCDGWLFEDGIHVDQGQKRKNDMKLTGHRHPTPSWILGHDNLTNQIP